MAEAKDFTPKGRRGDGANENAAQAKPPRERGGWLSKIAPGVRRLVTKRDSPADLWVKCPDTGEMIYRPDLEASLWVTPAGRHMRIGPDLRFAYTFDGGVHDQIETPSAVDDPLRFVDVKPYREKLATARKTTGEKSAVTVAVGEIQGQGAVVFVQDFAFMGGSLGMAEGEAFIAAAQAALKREVPLVAFTASGGARMQEGALALMQMARTTLLVEALKAARLPYLVVLTDPTTGGVTASYAMLGDVQLAEPGALVGFTGPRVIEQTIRETLPPGFQRAEYLVEKGMVDRVTPRKELPQVLGSILQTLMMGRGRLPPPDPLKPDYDAIRASDAAVQRLRALHPSLIDLSTDRIKRLLVALGHPERRMGPVIHVAGTNGKGSTCANLRSIAEAAGLKVHVLTSPHLVRFAERIRVAGKLISDEDFARLTDEVEAANAGEPISFFEITVALAFHAFAEHPADLCVIEVGLGGRFDASNVFDAPAVSVITPVDLDHLELLGPDLGKIAWEKAGIIKPGRPVVVARQRPEAWNVIEREATSLDAPLTAMGRDFDAHASHGRMVVTLGERLLDLPQPSLFGAHQIANAGLAVAALDAFGDARIDEAAMARGVASAVWPGRFQRLTKGPFAEKAAAAGADLWLDGAHNPHAGRALADAAQSLKARDGRPVVLIVGMLGRKDAAGFFATFAELKPKVFATSFESDSATPADVLAAAAIDAGIEAEATASVDAALDLALAGGEAPHVIICGSLHFIGDVLARDPETWPT